MSSLPHSLFSIYYKYKRHTHMWNTIWLFMKCFMVLCFTSSEHLFKKFPRLSISLKGNRKPARIHFAVPYIWKGESHHTVPRAKVGVGEGFHCKILRSSTKWTWKEVTCAVLWIIANTEWRCDCPWRHNLPSFEKGTRLNCCL